ncbi:MAG: hypothetical protein M1470_12455 [Bacteroidetes bacterium]|nr:hypothetical protein [Bacteroidota bacterium]MCL5737087.1 hypothetical protein [Bacteroidota bacterium]
MKVHIDILYHVKGVHLIALSSPEHGIRGITDTKVTKFLAERRKYLHYE